MNSKQSDRMEKWKLKQKELQNSKERSQFKKGGRDQRMREKMAEKLVNKKARIEKEIKVRQDKEK